MPQIHVTVPTKVWSKEAKERAAVALTETLAEVIEKEMGQPNATPHINVFFEEAAEGGYVIGGQVLG